MYKYKKLALKIIVVGLASSHFLGCTGGNASSSFGSSNASTGSSVVPGSSNGVTDPNQLYVGVNSDINKIVHVHQLGQFSKPCSIPFGSTKQDLTCIIDVPEGEIVHIGMSMKYNVPPDMCNYFERKPYWYYKNEVGVGPVSLTVTRTLTNGLFTSATCSVDGSPAAACNAPGLEATIDPKTLIPTCIYDRSKTGGVNGCLGSYVMAINETNTVTAPPSTTVSNFQQAAAWGGSISTVIGGPGSQGWPAGPGGYPITQFVAALGGIPNQTYTMPPTLIGETLSIANYYKPLIHDHRGFVSATRSTLPYFIAPIDDLNGSALFTAQDSYEFSCVDAAQETIHRIRVYVREWNTRQDFNDYVASNGATEVPDRGGVEGVSCNGLVGPCNDFIDSDDFLANLGGLYDTTMANLRPLFFPGY